MWFFYCIILANIAGIAYQILTMPSWGICALIVIIGVPLALKQENLERSPL